MEGHTFLSWNLPNLISVWLMAAALIGVLYFAKQRMSQNAG